MQVSRHRYRAALFIAAWFLSFSLTASASADAGLASDDFNLACGLLGAEWTIIDPLGDSQFLVSGIGTSNAQLMIDVPSGVRHSIWEDAVTSPRLMQSATDDDFEVEVKYDSEPTESIQSQGIVVEGAGGELLRFDFYSNKGKLRIFSALLDAGNGTIFSNTRISAGSGELYMRVSRTGDTFTQSYSYNGSDWATASTFDAPIVLTGVGLHAGNDSALPAHTAAIDYFFVTSAPIVPEDGTLSGDALPKTLAVTLAGSGSGNVSQAPDLAEYPCGSSVTISAVAAPGSGFAGWTGDVSSTTNPLALTMGTDLSVTATFELINNPPIISNVSTITTADSATISWTTDYAATSIADYGETLTYELGSVVDGSYVVDHSIVINGLNPDTLYHYELVSVGEGTALAATSGDLTFTTSPPPSGPSDVFSDDFNRACGALDPRWTVIDPLGDSTVEVTGIGTSDAQLRISIPGGSEHNAWTEGLTAPRVVQPMNDADFEVEVRFQSFLSADIQGQGIIVENAAGDFVRFDFYSNGTDVRIFAGDVESGVGATHYNAVIPDAYGEYMRMARAGDLWTQEYSNDGVLWWPAASFSLAFTPTQIGVFALNSSSNPAHTVIADYFFNTSAPVSPEDGNVAGNTIPRTLTLDASVGGSAYPDPDLPSYTCGDSVTVTATPDAGHVFYGWTGDLVSTDNPLVVPMWNDVSLTAVFAPDVDPVVSGVTVDAGGDFATVSWTTDVPATSTVRYGPSSAYESGEVSDLVLKTSHSIQLGGLDFDAIYHFEASSTSDIGNSAYTGDLTFTTGPTGADPSGIVSDDFNSECSILGDQWNIVDPLGDSNLSLTGLGTDDAHLVIDVPGGVEHNLSQGNTDAPRVMQAINNGDFEIEVKFDSPLTIGTQAQGIVIQESATEFVRFGIYYNGRKLKAYAGTFSNDVLSTISNRKIFLTAPYYLRVTRSGDTWSQRVSDDGISWNEVASFNHAITVTQAGVYALNSNTNPPHTALVDYFESTNTPIVPEDGPTPGGTDKTVDITVNGFGTVSSIPDQPTYTCGEPVVLSAIADSGSVFTGWTGTVTSASNPLFLSVTSDTVLTANFSIDANPPVISDVTAHAGGTTALITWTTDEPATSIVDHGPTAAYENGSVSDLDAVHSHAVLLTGLSPDSTYHYLVTSVDAYGLPASTMDLTFTTDADRGPAGISSDDFDNNNVDTGLWTLTDPLGDSTITITGADTSDAQLLFHVPAGSDHSVRATSSTAPRLLQATADSDLRIEVRLDQGFTGEYQAQGIWIEAGPDEFITFDRHTDGLSDHIAATTYTGGVETVEIDVPIPTLPTIELRVDRLGDSWVLSYSPDGTRFIPVGSFTHVMPVTASGLFAATSSFGEGAPAFTSATDFYFDANAPINPEDNGASADVLPPLIQVVTTSINVTSVQIQWTTDEPSTSEVAYGLTASYELGGVFDPTPVRSHSVVLYDLDPETTYHFRVNSEDALAQSADSGDLQFTTTYPGYNEGPIIDLWYGDYQRFGHAGLMQSWVNVLGNVSDPDGVVSLEYTLNGGAPRPLSQGPDTRRLADPGDFNCDIDASELVQGLNTVSITAVGGDGKISRRDVTVDFDGATIPSLPITIDWSSVSNIQDVAQPIDGLWKIEGDTIRALQMDYDRLLGVGDVSYTDYEMTVPVTIHAIDPGGFEAPSNRPSIGIMLRWPGHTIRNNDQPATGFLPLGAIGFLNYKLNGVTRMSIVANTGTVDTRYTLPFGVTYVYKMRVETVPGAGGLYSVKLWEQGTPEPAEWLLTRQETLADPQNGAPVLVSHHVDASFGTVVITEIP
jgi:Divergent InlB B-repeat domain